MFDKTIYKNAFTREFTLVNMEIWWRGEVNNNKVWTDKRQPFLPYIVIEMKDGIVRAYYDERGILWIKNLLLDEVKKDKQFLSRLQKNFMSYLSKMREIYNSNLELSREKLLGYLKFYEEGYVWFEAGWWLWDMAGEKRAIILPDNFLKLREETQDFVPKSEELIRKSLTTIYPGYADFVDVIRISEIAENIIPERQILVERKSGYYFVDNKLYAGITKKFIEQKYKIRFESIKNNNNGKDIKGSFVFKGKVSGLAKIVLALKDSHKINNGDILISAMTLPEFLPVIKKAAALVTDEGGILSHAAIIARELKKPCIIGTKIATKVLHDGDLVEIDANKGIVKILKRAT